MLTSLNRFSFACLVLLFTSVSVTHADSFDPWLGTQSAKARSGVLAAISPADAARGAVIASPSRDNPNYYWHWIRDAALVMNTVVEMYDRSDNDGERQRYFKTMMEYLEFSRRNQLTPNRSGNPWDTGLGEPKFLVDGRAFDEDWGRPQNDGPALRAITLIRFARILLNEGKSQLVRDKFYDGKIPAQTVIKADLEFVSHHWRSSSFDLWEEVKGHHFYTRLVQRRALFEGALLARQLGDGGAADWYQQQAKQMESEIHKHWHHDGRFLMVTLGQEGMEYKSSGLDSSVILASLHADGSDRFYDVTSDRVQATLHKQAETFANIYTINRRATDNDGKPMAPAIGRYPEDKYDGNGISLGNPWVLTTAAFGELFYRLAAANDAANAIHVTDANLPMLSKMIRPGRGSLHVGDALNAADPRFHEVQRGLREQGDRYLRRVRLHAFPDGALSEQMNRESGFMQGARDLTWSYASFLTAAWSRLVSFANN